MTIDIDSELLPSNKSSTNDDPSISDSSDTSPQCQCEVSLGKVDCDFENSNPDTKMDENSEDATTIILLDSDVSVHLNIENEDGNSDNEFDVQTTDDPVISNSDTATPQCTGAPRNKETKESSDDMEVNEEEWPKAFYCQRTHIQMINPLVGPDGSSIDRSAVDEADQTSYYSNRALEAIIQETMTLRKHPFRAGLKQLQQSVSHGLSNLLPDWNSHESLFRPLNDAFYCPITYNLMHQPVIDPEGNTFERVAVENWIRINQSSPITRTDLRIEQLYPNRALEKLLQEEKERPEDQMHPAIRKWKDEPMPMATDVELGGGAVREREFQRQSREAQNSSLVLISRTPGGRALFYPGGRPFLYPVTYQQLLLRRENNLRTRYRFFGYAVAGCSLMTFVVNEHLVFLMVFLLSLLFVFLKRPIYNR